MSWRASLGSALWLLLACDPSRVSVCPDARIGYAEGEDECAIVVEDGTDCRVEPMHPTCVSACASADFAWCASGVDGGADAGMDAGSDAGPCGVCAAPTPVCDPASGSCVACLTHEDCGPDGRCDTEAFACVDCLSHVDCTDPLAAQCDSSGACVPCDHSDQCAGTGLSLCSNGACVECDAMTEDAACDGNACDLATGTCSSEPLGSARPCEACLSDAHCQDGMRCVPMQYRGADHGNFCLKPNTDGCERPFSIDLAGRTSLGGEDGLVYCGINENLTTCEAVRALLDDAMCPGGTDEECPEGGLCRRVGSLNNRCTYPCAGSQQCLDPAVGVGSTCGPGDTGGPDYCGG